MGSRLKDKVAVITGASSGIGEATAQTFIDEGAYVVLGDIQKDLGNEVAERLGDRAKFVSCDVTRENNVEELITQAIGVTGSLDVMMNNAGIVRHGLL